MAAVNDQANRETRAASAQPFLATRIASLHRRHFGRGPRGVRVHVFDDLLVAVLEGFATQLEATLSNHGRADLVVAGRSAALPALESELRALVEETLLRAVTAVMAGADPEADVATLIVALAPHDPGLQARLRKARRDSAVLQSDSRALRAQSEQALRHASEVIEKHSK
jgi:uncharacterized protein YbcI